MIVRVFQSTRGGFEFNTVDLKGVEGVKNAALSNVLVSFIVGPQLGCGTIGTISMVSR
jgi:hypothetical protein